IALKSAILDNEKLYGTALYKTIGELAIEYQVTTTTIHQVRHRMGIPPTGLGPQPAHNPNLTPTLLPAVTTTEGLLKVLEDEPLLTATDRLRILSRLIRTGPPPIKIAAIKTYEELTRVTTDQ